MAGREGATDQRQNDILAMAILGALIILKIQREHMNLWYHKFVI